MDFLKDWNVWYFTVLQYAHALSTVDGYTGYGPEQGNKVRSTYRTACFSNYHLVHQISIETFSC